MFEERVRRHEERVQAYEIRLAAYEAAVRALEALREPPPSPVIAYLQIIKNYFI